MALHIGVGAEFADSALEVEPAARHLQAERGLVALGLGFAQAEIQRQRHAVHRGGAGHRQRPLQGADRSSGLDLLGFERLSGLRIGVTQRALDDAQLAHREMQAGRRRAL